MKTENVIEQLKEEFLYKVNFNADQKDPQLQQRYETELFDWFLFGLKKKDSNITRTVLEIIARYQNSVYKLDLPEEDFRRFILDCTKFGSLLNSSEAGERFEPRKLTEVFTPFYGTPEELLQEFRDLKQLNPAIQPIKDLFEGITDGALQDPILAKENTTLSSAQGIEFKNLVRDYFSSWLEAFWPVLEANEKEFINSYFGFSTPMTAMTHFLCELVHEPEFANSFAELYAFVLKCEEKYRLEAEGRSWLEIVINHAICASNMRAFSLLVAEAKKRHEEITIWGR